MIKVSLFRLTWGSALVTLALTIGALSCASAKPDEGTAETDGIAPTMAEPVVPACEDIAPSGHRVIRQYTQSDLIVVFEGRFDDELTTHFEHCWTSGYTTHCVVETDETPSGFDRVESDLCSGRDDDKQDPNAWSKGGE